VEGRGVSTNLSYRELAQLISRGCQDGRIVAKCQNERTELMAKPVIGWIVGET